MTGSVEGNTRNQADIYLSVVGKGFADGFHDMKGSLLKVNTRGVATEFYRLIASDFGQ